MSRLTIAQGILQGFTGKDLNGNKFLQFLSIPYAKPPVGKLRFKEPLPPEKWDGIRNATKGCNICYSRDILTGTIHGSEDCLFLNVFTKALPSENPTLKPVMVWFHGGAFMRGTISPSLYGPEFLMMEDIVLVTVQYRIGVLGFLRLHDHALGIYGNAGLKDQTMALKWVRNNIESFGGDPGNVTIFGNSAGGTSVSYHLVSPLSRGLFHKAIIQSGSSIKGWDECAHNPIHLAQYSDKNIQTEKEVLALLSTLPVEQLYELQAKYIEDKELCTINKQFGPVLENSDNKGAFITDNAINIIESGEYNDVPIIVGYNDKEGMLFHFYKMLNPKRILTIDDAIPHFFNLPRGCDERKQLENDLKSFYFENDSQYEDNLIDLLSDVAYITPSYAIAVNHSKASKHPVYLYRFSLDTSINFLKHFAGLSHKTGACHFDEVSYLLNSERTGKLFKPGSIEDKFIRRMVKLWTCFAKCGNPTPSSEEEVEKDRKPTWKPFTVEERNYLDIGEEIRAGTNPDRKRIEFWTQIYKKYNKTEKFL